MAQLYSSTFSLKISSVELVSLSLYPTWQCQWKTQRQIQMQIHRQIQIQSASKTQFMLYFWRAGGLRISNMTWTLGCPRIGYFQKIGWLEYDRWSPRVAKDQGEPHRDGWDGLKPDRSYLSHGRGGHKDKYKDKDTDKDKYKVLQRPNVCYIFEEQGVLGEDVRMMDKYPTIRQG